MKFVKLILVCLLAAVGYCFSNKSNQYCNEIAAQDIVFDENSIIPDTSSQNIENSDNLLSGFTKVYTMKKKDSTVIGDVYVKFENDSLFRYLYVVNKSDTLYSIKKNTLFLKDGKVDLKGSADNIYGYTFCTKWNDLFELNAWDKNGECAGDGVMILWDYDKNILNVLKW